MAMIPMKTIIAEKAMLLIVLGSQVFEALLFDGMFGRVAGSFRNTILPDEWRVRL
jgi:hypothetical protein